MATLKKNTNPFERVFPWCPISNPPTYAAENELAG